jgi:uncharacterized protein
MDYLERDSRSIGVTYGLFDRNRVLKSFLCFRRGEGKKAEYRLGVKRSGIPAMENLVQARFELFVQVYYHKTNQAISLMLSEIARRAHQAKIVLFPVDAEDVDGSLHRLIDRYVDLSDDQFVRVLRGKVSGYQHLPSEAITLADQIENRVLWKRLYEGDEQGATYVAAGLRRDASAKGVVEDILPDTSKPKATKDLDKGATLLSRDQSGFYTPIFERSWYEFSIIIEALRKAEGNIGRVYATREALRDPQFKQLAGVARRLGRDYDIERLRRRKIEREIEERVRREVEEA